MEQQKKSNEEWLMDTLIALNDTMERLAVALGMPKYYSRRKMLYRSFLSGMARGLGMAVGFTVLGALLISLLTFLASKNLPIIGAFIANIVRMVQNYMP